MEITKELLQQAAANSSRMTGGQFTDFQEVTPGDLNNISLPTLGETTCNFSPAKEGATEGWYWEASTLPIVNPLVKRESQGSFDPRDEKVAIIGIATFQGKKPRNGVKKGDHVLCLKF